MPFSNETIAYAVKRGVDPFDLPLVCDGCSGGISWLYALTGESISIEQCCHRHDIDYELGGSDADRKAADKRLRNCALEKAGGNALKKARAWIIYGCVRVFGRPHWAGE